MGKRDRGLGMPTKEGTLLRERDGFVVKIGRKKQKISVGPMATREELTRLVGKKVEVVYSLRDEDLAIGFRLAKVALDTAEKNEKLARRLIMCYYPGPDWEREVRIDLRKTLLRRMVKDEIVSRTMAREVRRGF